MGGKFLKSKSGKKKQKAKNSVSSPELFQAAWFIVVFIAAAIATIAQIRSAPGSIGRELDASADPTDPSAQYRNRVDYEPQGDAVKSRESSTLQKSD